jgi:hypothetical protein
VLQAIFTAERKFAERVEPVVNDGLRQRVQIGRAWATEALQAVVRRHGNQLLSLLP